MALAMNRYIGNSVLSLLISHSQFYNESDNHANLLDATLHTVYRLSKNRMLTKGQREAVSDFLVALTRYVTKLLYVTETILFPRSHDPVNYISPERAQAMLNMPVPVGMKSHLVTFLNFGHLLSPF